MTSEWIKFGASQTLVDNANAVTPPRAYQEELAALHRVYAEGLAGRLAELRAAWDSYLRDPSATKQLATFVRLAHNLAGASAMFGYDAQHAEAYALEKYAKSIPSNIPPNAEQQVTIALRLNALTEACKL